MNRAWNRIGIQNDINRIRIRPAQKKVPDPQHKIAPGGSTGTDINGHAVRLACEKLRLRLDAVRSRFPALKSWEEVVLQVGLRIRIHFIRIRIQHFRLNTDPDPIRIEGFNDQKLKKIKAGKNYIFLDQKLQFTYP